MRSRKSEGSSHSAKQEFRSHRTAKLNYRIDDAFGAEAYLWGIRGSIAFRYGNLTVYVTAVVIRDLDDGEGVNNNDEGRPGAEQPERDEEAVVTRGFAHQVAAILLHS